MSVFDALSKINLYLRVAGKRADGYHEIETLFLPLKTPADRIGLELFPGEPERREIFCETPGVPCDETNLCARAADRVLAEMKLSCGYRIRIDKRIPVCAGMGGGSSDAAAVITLLQQELGELPDKGKEAALSIGADVPFFLDPRPAVGRGRGEMLEFLPEFSVPDIRIHPMNFPITAKWAYQHWKVPAGENRSLQDLLSALTDGDFEKASHFLRNDLAHAPFEKFPVLTLHAEALRRNGAQAVQMTGSGPTLFWW